MERSALDNSEQGNTTMCLFPGTDYVYIDCCTSSSIKLCNVLCAMFFVCLALYVAIIYYLVRKNPWIKRHGLYLNVFVFQLLVLLRNFLA